MTRALAAAVLGAALWAAPVAGAAFVWHDAGAALPADVSLRDVATGSGGLVVAVGSEGGAPAISRFAAGHWHSDTIALPAGTTATSATLASVAIAGTSAWAIGSYDTAATVDAPAATHPLVARLAGSSLNADAAAAWSALSGLEPGPNETGTALATPTQIALQGETAALIGADDGKLYPVTVAGAAATVGAPLAPDLGGATAIAGVATWGSGNGYAVANDETTDAPRFFSFDQSSTSLDSRVGLSQAPVAMQGVAALSPTNAIAIDSRLYWETDGTRWTRRTAVESFAEDSSSLADVATAAVTGHGIEAIAGGWLGHAAVWSRIDGGVWTRDDYALGDTGGLTSLDGVAVAANGDLWAVGDRGTILHRYDEPPPPPPAPPATDASSSQDVTTQPTEAPPEQPSSPTSEPEPGPAPSTQVVVSQPPTPPSPSSPTPRKPKPAPARLVTDVAIKGAKRALVVSFTLKGPATVALVARRGKQVVGRTAGRKLRPGRRRLVVPYKGSGIPTQLKIVVQPAGSVRRGATK